MMSSMASGHAISETFDIAPTANSPHNMSNHTEAACSALIEAAYSFFGCGCCCCWATCWRGSGVS